MSHTLFKKTIINGVLLSLSLVSLVNANAICGSANGQTFSSIPTANLCESGIASSVIGNGPWTRSCNGGMIYSSQQGDCGGNAPDGPGITCAIAPGNCSCWQESACNANIIASSGTSNSMLQTTIRDVECRDNFNNIVSDSFCNPSLIPSITGTQMCPTAPPSIYAWVDNTWGVCAQNLSCQALNPSNISAIDTCGPLTPSTCASQPLCMLQAIGGGTQTMDRDCRDQNGVLVADSLCPQPEPVTTQPCSINNNNTGNNNGTSTCNLDTTIGGGCFVADTLIIMYDGSSQSIQNIKIGDKVKALNGANTVKSLLRPLLGNQPVYAINNTDGFFTANHPFLTTKGWKSIDPETTKKEIPDLKVTKLQIGDTLISSNKKVIIVSITPITKDTDTQLYNFELDGDHTYYANNYIVHNKLAQGSLDGNLGDSCIKNNDCRTPVAGKPPMACDNTSKTCKYTKPSPGFMCQVDSNGNLINWSGAGCGDWAVPNYIGICPTNTGELEGNVCTGTYTANGGTCGEPGEYPQGSIGDTVNGEMITNDGTLCSNFSQSQCGTRYTHGCTRQSGNVTNSCSVFNGNQSACNQQAGCSWDVV